MREDEGRLWEGREVLMDREVRVDREVWAVESILEV